MSVDSLKSARICDQQLFRRTDRGHKRMPVDAPDHVAMRNRAGGHDADVRHLHV